MNFYFYLQNIQYFKNNLNGIKKKKERENILKSDFHQISLIATGEIDQNLGFSKF